MKMTRWIAAWCVAAAATVTAFAAPNAKWVPANADFVLTADGLDASDPAAEKVWKDGLAKIGIETSATAETIKGLDEEYPGMSDFLKALFGCADDFNSISTKSLLLFGHLKQDKDGELDDSSIALVLENPKADLAALEAAAKQLLDAQCANECKLERKDAWLLFTQKDADEKGVIAICTIPEGYLVTLQPTLKDAEALRTGKFEPLPANSPLQQAFKARPEGVRTTTTYVLGDLTALVNRLTPADKIEAMKIQNPVLFQIKDIVLTALSKGTDCDITTTINTANAANAQKVMEAVLGYKMLVKMIAPSFTGKPDSKIVALIDHLGCTTKDNATVLTFKVTPDVMLPVIQEINELQKQAEASMNEMETLDDLFEDDEDEDDDTPMTAEEAEAILDALEEDL